MNLIDKARIDKYIESVKWQNSKTYEMTAPHEYTIREWRTDLDEEFVWFATYIRANGLKEYFYKKQLIYLYYNGYKYWTMGNPMDDTRVLNRTDDMKIYK